MSIIALNSHITDLPPTAEKFDTLVSPSGTVATLNQVAQENNISHMGFDSAFPGPQAVQEGISDHIEQALSAGKTPVLFSTCLVYNAEATLREITSLKRDFPKLVTVVGGQLIPFATQAYIPHPAVDINCIGDAEVLYPKIIADTEPDDLKSYYNDWLSRYPEKRG